MSSSHDAFLVAPRDSNGPGVLVLPSWNGVTDPVRELCRALAADGFVAMAPDLLDGDTGPDALAGADPNHLTTAVVSSLRALQHATGSPLEPVGVIGFSMGGSLAMWASVREPGAVAAVVTYYGTQDMDLGPSEASYLGHFASDDDYVSGDERRYTEALIGLAGRPAEFHVYPRTSHFFAEADAAEYAADAARSAWDRTITFLREALRAGEAR